MSNQTTDERIAHITRILLAQKQTRQTDLAAYLDMDTGSMSRAMHGNRKWTAADVEALAGYFGVEESVFFHEPDTLIRSRCFSIDDANQQSLFAIAA
jgi:transcriptional regulator with XRE-family HTH domain